MKKWIRGSREIKRKPTITTKKGSKEESRFTMIIGCNL